MQEIKITLFKDDQLTKSKKAIGALIEPEGGKPYVKLNKYGYHDSLAYDIRQALQAIMRDNPNLFINLNEN